MGIVRSGISTSSSLNSGIFDVTEFAQQHPGGSGLIYQKCGHTVLDWAGLTSSHNLINSWITLQVRRLRAAR